MNGEILQSCKIAAAAKLALKEKKLIHCEPAKYVHSITFNFLPHQTLLTTKAYKAPNIKEWYEKTLSQGLLDINTQTIKVSSSIRYKSMVKLFFGGDICLIVS